MKIQSMRLWSVAVGVHLFLWLGCSTSQQTPLDTSSHAVTCDVDWPPRNLLEVFDFEGWEQSKSVDLWDDGFLDRAEQYLKGSTAVLDKQPMPESESTEGAVRLRFPFNRSGVWKPANRLEHGLYDAISQEEHLRLLQEQVLFYELDKDVLGFGIVPASRVIESSVLQQTGMLAVDINGFTSTRRPSDEGWERLVARIAPTSIGWRLVLLDFLFVIQSHRPYRDVVVLKDGRLAALDNVSDMFVSSGGLSTEFSDYVYYRKVAAPKDVQHDIERLLIRITDIHTFIDQVADLQFHEASEVDDVLLKRLVTDRIKCVVRAKLIYLQENAFRLPSGDALRTFLRAQCPSNIPD